MDSRNVTKIEYLLRTVRESERMTGWQDAFSNAKDEIMKQISEKEINIEKDSLMIENGIER